MQKFFLRSLVIGGLVVGSAGCTDDGEKSWPSTTGAGSSSSSSSGDASSSSSSGTAGMGGTGGMGGAATGGMGGSAGMGGMGGMGGAATGGMGGMGGMGGAATGGMGGMGGNGGSNNAPPDPMNLMVTIEGQNVKFDWTKSVKPTSIIVRKFGSAPTDVNDPGATIVYVGTGSTSTEPLRNLLPNTPTVPRVYHYAVYGCDGTCKGIPATATLTPTISQCLVGGGYNVIWRHASANVCSDLSNLGYASTTSSPDWWRSCDSNCGGAMPTATARQLNATGFMEADAIGKSLAAKTIPFGRMLSSEYCRCFTTADLMKVVPMGSVELKQELTHFVYDNVADRCVKTMGLLATEPPVGANTGLISHAGFSCPTIDSLAWAEAAIYKPDGMGGSTYITRVVWDQWDALP